jgi:hypothetical protein
MFRTSLKQEVAMIYADTLIPILLWWSLVV